MQIPAIRWAVLRASDRSFTDGQRIALAELEFEHGEGFLPSR
jgi:hypothetical protein